MKRALYAFAFVLGACTSSGAPTTVKTFDFAMPPGGNVDLATNDVDMAGSPMDGGSSCSTYSMSSIHAMRMGATSGCFELDGVVTIATTPQGASSTSIRIIAQDSAGGDYSGIVLNCYSTSSSHPCTAYSTAKSILPGRTVTVQGFYEKASAMKGAYEYFSIDGITDTASGTAPAPASVMLSDIERGGNQPKYWFQKVSLTIAAGDQLKAYDWTPPEFKATSGCHVYGFGMLPKSATGTATPACSGTTTQPAGQTSPSANEVLFGTDYYTTFKANTECTCLSSSTMMPYPGLLQSTSTLSGAVKGILFYDAYSSAGYQYLSPVADADAPITNLSM